MVILVEPRAMVILRHEMVKAEDMSAPLACERHFQEDLPAMMTPAHHVCIVGW
jgi:hypothetical protein